MEERRVPELQSSDTVRKPGLGGATETMNSEEENTGTISSLMPRMPPSAFQIHENLGR
jgi:hypothetical protein